MLRLDPWTYSRSHDVMDYTFDQAARDLAQEIVDRLWAVDTAEHSYVAYYMSQDGRGVNNLAQVLTDMGLAQSPDADQPTVRVKARKFGNA